VPKKRRKLRLADEHGQHGARLRQALHQPAALSDQA